MDTKVVALPERTQPLLPVRDMEISAAQVENSAKLETAGSIYLSPVVRIDNDTQTAVLQYRDSKTGKVLRQFPPKAGSDAYAETERRAKKEVELRPVQHQPEPKGVESDSAKTDQSSSRVV